MLGAIQNFSGASHGQREHSVGGTQGCESFSIQVNVTYPFGSLRENNFNIFWK
jgi:hypothetical protein